MVAVIKTGHSILRLLNYNEQKVSEGVALLLGAVNYPIDAVRLSFSQKLARLRNQAALNENVSRNSVHISLNFDPSEKLPGDTLTEIAGVYMDKIGMGDLPYLIYQHFDAGHPHIHIVSVKVRADGRRVDTQNIGRNQSKIARQEIERMYGLVIAGDKQRAEAFRVTPVNVAKVLYGRSATKRAIGNVLESVFKTYRFASLPELNAVLKQYNVVADRGEKESQVFRNQGLVYRVLDADGNKIGVPIKASDFYNNPGLKFLAGKYIGPGEKKDAERVRLRNAIDLSLMGGKMDLNGLIAALKKDGVDVVLRQNNDGVIYGITYVDHQKRVVFNGSDLGKAYSAKGVLERLAGHGAGQKEKQGRMGEKPGYAGGQVGRGRNAWVDGKEPGFLADGHLSGAGKLVAALLETDMPPEQMDWQLKRKKRTRKRQRLSPD